MNVYYDPEKFGLTPVGEIEWSSGCYEFDLTVVWRRNVDGRLVYAEDSGCSCPTPFEGTGIEDLTLCTPAELQVHLQERATERRYYEEENYRAAEIADLMKEVTMP